jgi:hypothetical protein
MKEFTRDFTVSQARSKKHWVRRQSTAAESNTVCPAYVSSVSFLPELTFWETVRRTVSLPSYRLFPHENAIARTTLQSGAIRRKLLVITDLLL